MPEEWTDKQERQYRHIRESYMDRGVSEREAEERAARTVNERRDARGEARGGDHKPTKHELYERAQDAGIKGRSKMDKEQLENALAGHKGGSH